ncbi:hypothetical protein LPJ59_001210 [Coemansia sp. RSA 2399]|nr:hypothetical protein LPJ59_001210 [Coemansia sp. RSA 2399]
MKKPSRGKLLLSFGSAFDDDDESFSYGGKGGFPSNSNDSHAPSALERLASEKQHGPEPNALGFVFVHLLETEQHSVYEGPKVPPTFTGSHKPPSSRWDSVPATGSQSVCGHGRASRTLVTAVDRAKLRIVDDNTTIVSKQEAFLLDAAVARAALERGFMPFVDDMRKQQRYKEFLQSAADGDIVATGSRNQNESTRETKEFARMAHAFQPNTAMLSRFTRSTQQTDAGSPGSTKASATQAAPDTRSSARKHATRTVLAWAPSQLLCKRMGVPPPPTAIPHLPKHPSNTLSNQKGPGRKRAADFIDWSGNSSTVTAPMVVASEQSVVAPTNRPDMSLFKAIFGDSS